MADLAGQAFVGGRLRGRRIAFTDEHLYAPAIILFSSVSRLSCSVAVSSRERASLYFFWPYMVVDQTVPAGEREVHIRSAGSGLGNAVSAKSRARNWPGLAQLRTLSFAILVVLMPLLCGLPVLAANSDLSVAKPLDLLKSGNYEPLERHYAGLQSDYESGVITDEQLYQGFRQLYEDSATNERYFDGWVQAFPNSYPARMARGAYYYRMAWFVRGGKFISETPPKQIEAMSDYVGKARSDLMASLKMTAKPYLSTLYLLNASMLDGSADERHWLAEGNAIDPGNVRLKLRYMESLTPRWGGSYEEMRAFLEECRQQHLPATTLAKLDFLIYVDLGDNLPADASPNDRYKVWKKVLELGETAGETPSAEALVGYSRAAWDLNRRQEADQGLEQLAKMQIEDGSILSQMGWMYTQENRMTEAWAVLQRGAALNDAWSQFAVGKTLYIGCPEINLPADHAAGLIWIRRAADQGFQEAKDFLQQPGVQTDFSRNSFGRMVDLRRLVRPMYDISFHDWPIVSLLLFVLAWLGGTTLLGSLSGWYGLMEQHPDRPEASLLTLKNQSGSVGRVGMRGVLNLSVCPSGLRIGIMRIFGPFCRNVFVPWEAISITRRTRVLGRTAILDFKPDGCGRLSLPAEVADRLARAALNRWPEPSTADLPPVQGESEIASGAGHQASPSRELKLQFNGAASEYFRIWIVNLCLTLMTFGIFSAWAKVRKKRYFYSHTVLDGTPFQYLGQPLPILKGRIVAAVSFAVYYAASHFFTSVLPVVIAAALVVAPWAIARSAAFTARYSAYRNMTFNFTGDYGGTLRTVYWLGLIPLVAVGITVQTSMAIENGKAAAIIGIVFALLGILFPWWLARLRKFLVSKTAFGGVHANITITGRQFWGIYFRGGLLISVGGAVGGGVSAVLVGAQKAPLSLASVLVLVCVYAGYILGYAYIKAASANLVWNNTTLQPLRFVSTLRGRDLAWLYLSNAVAIIASLSLLTPWAVVRTLRYRTEHMQVLVDGDLTAFSGSEMSSVQAAGAEVSEVFDLDLAL